MKKRTPLPCTPANCGDLYPKCGKYTTYGNHKCRCDSCYEAVSEKRRKHYEENRDAIIERVRQYSSENREVIAERDKRYREANPEKITEKSRRYAAENSEACVERARQWRLANPERYRENGRRGQQRRNARKKATQVVDFTPEQERQKMAYYGNSCYIKMPGVCTGAFDEVEHVKPLSKGGAHMIANFRPSCTPCNRRKHNQWPFKLAG